MAAGTGEVTGTARAEIEVPAGFELGEDDVLARLAWRRAAERPQHVSFERFVSGSWRAVTAQRHLDGVVATARGLIASGVESGGRVAIMAGTSYEWVLLDTATWAAGGITVPVYPSSAPAQVEWIVRDSGARILVVETEDMRRTVQGADLGEVEVLVLGDGALELLARRGREVPAEQVEQRVAAVGLDDPASIIYTSGTTGRPKGCVLTHRNLAAEARAVLAHPLGRSVGYGRRTLMFLPLAHVLARAITYAASEGGATVGFWADTSTIVEKLGSFRPNMVLAVPRVLEKVHAGVRHKATEGGPAKAEIFRRAERVAITWSELQEQGRAPGVRLRAEHALFDRLVYRSIRQALGGDCQCAISGGGPLSVTLNHFFRGVGLPVYEGYGLTESSAAITVNGPGCHRVGTVGRPIAGNAVRIAPSGEIELRGLVVFGEYWKNPDATRDAFDDGWFRTGDLGSLDEDGYLRITGRQKEIIVTAGGKNVVPGPLEDVLRAHPVVGHAMVVGEGRPFVAALITLDPEGARRWAQENGRATDDLAALAGDEQLRAEIATAVDAASATVSRAEGIRKFTLLPTDFTEDGGELTATMKLKRHVIEERYAREVEAMYRR